MQAKRNPGIDWNLLLLLGVGWWLYKSGALSKLLGDVGQQVGAGTGGSGHASSLTEDQAALIVSQHRPDLCSNIAQWSSGQYNCASQANTITLVQRWWYTMSPPERAQYSTLQDYVRAMGWA